MGEVSFLLEALVPVSLNGSTESAVVVVEAAVELPKSAANFFLRA